MFAIIGLYFLGMLITAVIVQMLEGDCLAPDKGGELIVVWPILWFVMAILLPVVLIAVTGKFIGKMLSNAKE